MFLRRASSRGRGRAARSSWGTGRTGSVCERRARGTCRWGSPWAGTVCCVRGRQAAGCCEADEVRGEPAESAGNSGPTIVAASIAGGSRVFKAWLYGEEGALDLGPAIATVPAPVSDEVFVSRAGLHRGGAWCASGSILVGAPRAGESCSSLPICLGGEIVINSLGVVAPTATTVLS